MARIRTVKPELFEHEDLFDAEAKTGLPLRLAFIGLFTCCDREGRFKWRPRSLKKNVMPYDDLDFSRVLHALGTRGFVWKYVIDGEEYGVIPTFHKHQVINNREAVSDLPAPTETSYVSMTSTREPRVDDACGTRLVQDQGEGKGKEGKGREGEGDIDASSRADAEPSALPVIFCPAADAPDPPEPKFDLKAELAARGVQDQTAGDWLKLRKAQRAPVTQTVLKKFIAEADKAAMPLERVLSLCCTKGWRGFEAEWVENLARGQPRTQGTLEETQRRNNAEAMRLLGIPNTEVWNAG